MRKYYNPAENPYEWNFPCPKPDDYWVGIESGRCSSPSVIDKMKGDELQLTLKCHRILPKYLV